MIKNCGRIGFFETLYCKGLVHIHRVRHAKVPWLCSPCLYTSCTGLLLYLNVSQLCIKIWLIFRCSRRPLPNVNKQGEQSHGTFGVTDSVHDVYGLIRFYMRKSALLQKHLPTRAGRSPTFQDPGTPLDGLAGTRVPASPTEKVLRPGSPILGFRSQTKWTPTRESHVGLASTRVPGYPFQLYCLHNVSLHKFIKHIKD